MKLPISMLIVVLISFSLGFIQGCQYECATMQLQRADEQLKRAMEFSNPNQRKETRE